MVVAPIYVSSAALRAENCLESVTRLVAAGIDHIELTAGASVDDSTLNGIRAFRHKGVKFLVHNYFPVPVRPFVLNLASNDDETLQLSMEHCKGAIDLCAELGSTLYTVHFGFCFHATPSDLGRSQKHLRIIPKTEAMEIFSVSVHELAEYGASRGVSVALENNVVSAENGADFRERYLGVEADEILEALALHRDYPVGLLLDVAHLKVSARTLGFSAQNFIRDVGSRVRAVHLSDNDGLVDCNGLISKESYFWSSLREFVPVGVPRVIEVYRLDPKTVVEQRDLAVRCSSSTSEVIQ